MLDARGKITESASSKALVVRRCTLSLILSKQTGVKSIGSKTLRVNGSIAACVGSSSAFFDQT